MSARSLCVQHFLVMRLVSR